MMDNFSTYGRKIMNLALQEASNVGSEEVRNEHALLALMKDKDCIAPAILAKHGLNYSSLAQKIISENDYKNLEENFVYSDEIKRLVENAAKLAQRFGSSNMENDHIFIAILSQEDSYTQSMLFKLGISLEEAIEMVIDKRRKADYNTIKELEIKKPIYEQIKTKKVHGHYMDRYPMLKSYSVDLTFLAKEGELPPSYEIEEYTQRIMQILCRKSKNSPILVGDSGTGKTSVVYALAHKMAKGTMPDILQDKRLISFDISKLVGSVKFRGEIDEKLERIIGEVKGAGDLIIFMENFQTLSIMANQENAADAAILFKNALENGDIQVIGEIGQNEYKRYMEKDDSLKRQIQLMRIEEPDDETALEIMRTIRPSYEEFHNLIITDDTLSDSIKLSKRFIQDKNLPDKAVDVLDEACARKRLGKSQMLRSYENLNLKISRLREDLAENITNSNYQEVKDIKEHVEYLNNKVMDLNENYKKSLGRFDVLNRDDITQAVSSMTGIPVEKLGQDEAEKLINLSDILKEEVIGQEEAIESLVLAVQRARTGLKDHRKPIGSFIFLGPTGVGKTHLCKALAKNLFDDESSLIRVDMSEYMEKYDVSKMIGSPPGYVGHSDGGQLTEKVKKKPYSVILFDEIEKAHPDIFDLLLQVLDEGHLTDSKGNKVDFKNTIIIMTSNIGAKTVNRSINFGFAPKDGVHEKMGYETLKSHYNSELKKHFKPEFLNRIDEIVVFNSLGEKEIEKIVRLMLDELQERLMEQKITLEVENSAIGILSKDGFSEEYGARPLQRSIQKMVENELAMKILERKIKPENRVKIKSGKKGLEFEVF